MASSDGTSWSFSRAFWTANAVELLERARRTPQASHGGIADGIAERLEDLRG